MVDEAKAVFPYKKKAALIHNGKKGGKTQNKLRPLIYYSQIIY